MYSNWQQPNITPLRSLWCGNPFTWQIARDQQGFVKGKRH